MLLSSLEQSAHVELFRQPNVHRLDFRRSVVIIFIITSPAKRLFWFWFNLVWWSLGGSLSQLLKNQSICIPFVSAASERGEIYKTLQIFLTKRTCLIWILLDTNVPRETLYQDCSSSSDPFKIMAAKRRVLYCLYLYIVKTLKIFMYKSTSKTFKQNVALVHPLLIQIITIRWRDKDSFSYMYVLLTL